jgi:hypothetical protein
MKKIAVIILLLLVCLEASIAQNISLDWAVQMGGSSYDLANSITSDSSGNTYTTGRFRGTADFDPSTGISNLMSNGASDIFIEKLDSDGRLVWVKQIGGSQYDVGNSIISAGANLYLIGNFSDTVDFDPSAGVFNLISKGDFDVFILKLDTAGNFIWAKGMGGPATDFGRCISQDINGNILTVGNFKNTVDFDPGLGIFNLSTNNKDEVFVHKLDSNGNFIWAEQMGGSSNDIGFSITSDNIGNVFTTGRFQGTADFDRSSGAGSLTSSGSNDIFIHKLSSNGTFQWVKQIGGTLSDASYSISCDLNNNLVLTGSFKGTVDFDPNAGIVNLISNGNSDIFLLKLNANGSFVWVRQTGGTGAEDGVLVFTDQNGYLYTTGHFSNTVDFDPGISINTLTSNGSSDIYAQKFDANGNLIWASQSGGSSFDIGYSISADPSGAVYLAGYFQGNSSFEPSNGAASLTTYGLWDAFVQKIIECSISYGSEVHVACDSYTWIDGNTYAASNNTAVWNLTNSEGCDSVISLDLTIVNSSSSSDSVTACDSFTWLDGNTYTTSNNTATWTLINSVGCDSVIALNLTISHPDSTIDVINACGSYTWINGITYTQSNNTAVWNLANTAGCDSMITLNLTIANSNSATDSITACDSYTWIDGNTYTASNNTAVWNLTNTAACDSVISLDLTILNSSSSIDSVSACDSYTWIDGNTYTASNNTATWNLTNAAACDSVISLDLTILNSSSSTDSVSACDSYTWRDGNTYTVSNNTATWNLTNAAACDSVISLDLTILNSSSSTDSVSACDSYTWLDGNTYTASNNTATWNLTNTAACDSVISLDLTILNSSSSTDSVSACDSYTWIDGNTYTASNNTATWNLTNAAACDSVISLDLTILNSSSSTDSVSACDSYTWLDGISYNVSNNTATWNLTNSAGCDSVLTLALSINPLNTSLSQVGNTLMSNLSGAAYQWLDCDNNYSILSGETGQSYTPLTNGNYSVELSQNACIDTSACYLIANIGFSENDFGNDFRLYPNPTKGPFSIDLGQKYPSVAITMYSIDGKVIKNQVFHNAQNLSLNIQSRAGAYLLLIGAQEKKALVRIVKE